MPTRTRTIVLQRYRGAWDFRSIMLADHGIAFFSRKAGAAKFAKERGWSQSSVSLAYNRFNAFWIVWEIYDDYVRIATRNGSDATDGAVIFTIEQKIMSEKT